MKWLMVLMILSNFACNGGQPDTPASSSDSTINAIDPKGTIRDTAQYKIDTAGSDSASNGLTH